MVVIDIIAAVGLLSGTFSILVYLTYFFVSDGTIKELGGAVFRGIEKFFIVAMAVAGGTFEGMRTMLNGRQPLELPEWTGRERESLQADLEGALGEYETPGIT